MHISPGSIARNCTTTTKRLGLPNRLRVAPPSIRSSIPLPPESYRSGSLGRISGSSSVKCSNVPRAATDQVVSSPRPPITRDRNCRAPAASRTSNLRERFTRSRVFRTLTAVGRRSRATSHRGARVCSSCDHLEATTDAVITLLYAAQSQCALVATPVRFVRFGRSGPTMVSA
jgi:hypothetical protein